MSWLVSTIANSLKLDDNEELPKEGTKPTAQSEQPLPPPVKPADGENPPLDSPSSDHQTLTPRGVKEDLSEFSKTLSRQFWGVASFLAPPPDSEISDPNRQQQTSDKSDPDSLSTVGIAGIRSDLSEIGGRFRTGISKLSTHKTVSEFTKIATNLLQFESEEGEFSPQGAVGVTEEVVAFAKDVSLHPETWIDFPLPDDDEEEEEFELSDAQQEHALAVERLAPRLAALRLELCPGYMSDGSFWKIYFVLVHPRLTKEDALLLSTPQIMMARAMLTSELQRRKKTATDVLGRANVAQEGDSNSANEVHLTVPSKDTSESIPANISLAEPPTSMKASESIPTNVPSVELPMSVKASVPEPTNEPSVELPNSMKARNIEVDQHSLKSVEDPVVDKAVVEEVSVHSEKNEKAVGSTSISEAPSVEGKHDRFQDKEDYDDDEGDDWLKEDTEEISITGRNTTDAFEDEDVSFSDLEEDDDQDGEIPIKYNKVDDKTVKKKLQTETKESNDWFDVDDIDVA